MATRRKAQTSRTKASHRKHKPDNDTDVHLLPASDCAAVAFRNRLSGGGVGDELREAADGVGEAEEVTTVRRTDPVDGEILLW